MVLVQLHVLGVVSCPVAHTGYGLVSSLCTGCGLVSNLYTGVVQLHVF